MIKDFLKAEREEKCNYDLSLHCSGCTDPRSEGTHQGCTKEHGHIGCVEDKAQTPPSEFSEANSVLKDYNTEQSSWVTEFDEMWTDGILPYETTGPERDVVRTFITKTLATEREKLLGEITEMWHRNNDGEYGYSCSNCAMFEQDLERLRK